MGSTYPRRWGRSTNTIAVAGSSPKDYGDKFGMVDVQTSQLETFVNQYAGREYEIEITCPEFTSVCPKTGQPDFGTIQFRYTPDRTCVELKALKLYLQSYRQQGIFYEHVVNKILDDFVAACQPIRAQVIGDFRPRGGITTRVVATYQR